MQLAALATVTNRILLGNPLPFNVRNADRTLLLARGQRLQSQAQLDALLQRGCVVDLSELTNRREDVMNAPREKLGELWADSMNRIAQAMRMSSKPGFSQALNEASEPVLALIERDPDLAIFQVLRQEANADQQYGARRSLHCAITSQLVAQRLSWTPEECERDRKSVV